MGGDGANGFDGGAVAFRLRYGSGLAVVATTETDKLWDPEARNWRSTWLNMIGSVAFGISAVGAFVRPSTGELAEATLANLGTFVGALAGLVIFSIAHALIPGV